MPNPDELTGQLSARIRKIPIEKTDELLTTALAVLVDTMGALNLFHRDRQVFTSDDLEVARSVAVPISIYPANGRNQEQLQAALATRTEIGQAQGVLMHQFGINEATAFTVLRRLSQDNNVELNHTATQIVTAQTLPSQYGGTPADD